ncbi:MAG: pyrimidine 5'-nucleotidase [Burkholderiales bacterium]|nr:MAG: pyrimidine 5'-nucleotidase [Burkholderiales bacterium]
MIDLRRRTRRDARPHGARVTWLLDLDNTLHDALVHIMPRINRDMTDYVARKLALSTEAASELRVRYWKRYGATLLGMIAHHRIDPHEFLWQTHRFPDMHVLVRRRASLVDAIRALPGRRIVLTNAPRHYAAAVLRALGLWSHLDGLVAIEHTAFAGRWQPKPSRQMLRRLLARLRTPAARCVLVEDSPQNLAAAKACGMRTVLVSGISWRRRAGARPRAGRGRRIDVQVQSALTLSRVRR